MKRLTILPLLTVLILGLISTSANAEMEGAAIHYDLGSQISEQIRVQDRNGSELSLRQLISRQEQNLNVVFIFGGGGMGHEKTMDTGGLWCPDSFEDMKILRSLHSRYENSLGMVAIAIPPVYHTQKLGFENRVLLDSSKQSAEYQRAKNAFIESTQAAFSNGTIPIQPVYDAEFNLLISAEQQQSRIANQPIEQWHGAFRSANETQSYGVPNLWLVDKQGNVVAKPFRGNVYHADGNDIEINYSLNDVLAKIDELLNK